MIRVETGGDVTKVRAAASDDAGAKSHQPKLVPSLRSLKTCTKLEEIGFVY